MDNERKLRLIQVAKEFKVGLNTIVDHLQKKGIKSDGSPNTLVDSDTYAILEKEFGANRTSDSARDNIREKISTKQATISIEEQKPVEPKRNIVVKDEVQQPRILGRIELDKKGNPKQNKDGSFKAKTSHTLNPVPFIIYDNFTADKYTVKLGREDFGLSAVAATTVNMLGYEAPEIWDESMIEL